MKQAAVRLSLIAASSLALVATTCGAFPLKSNNANNSTDATTTAPASTPELQAADSRVKNCESQLEVAKKQLAAAKSLLKAAEADLKAARTERTALALRTQAAGLAQEAGMGTPKSLAQASTTQPIMTSAAPVANPDLRTQTMDYSSAPTPSTDNLNAGNPSIQLR